MKIKSISEYRVTRGDQTPDIDIDFESARRDDVKKYMEERFGKNNVVSAGTFGRLKLKSSLKDFSKVAGLSFQYVNEITGLIPSSQDDLEWYEIFELAQKNSKIYNFVQENVQLLNIIQKCMFQTRAASIHASAVIIVPDEDEFGNKTEVFDYMPVKFVDGMLVSEWEGKYLERAGFLKEDILGLSQLDKLKSIMKLIKQNHNKEIILEEIPLEDKKVYELFQKGLNEDIFQFGTFGIKSFCKGVKPENISELTSINALYRPGPMKANAHKDFIDIKFGKKEAKYDYGLKEVTEKTYGLYVYQEQIMKSVSVLGGLSLNQADEVRTIMKKFDKEKMALFKDKFIKGAIERGCDEYEASEIWQKLNNFSSYGFNKSHSAAYSIIGYYCQYLKYYYPLEFYTTALHFCSDDVITVSEILNEIPLVSENISVVQPCVNKSSFNFTSDKNKIFWSLTKIKFVGIEIVKQIVEERRKNGNFYSITEFVKRVGSKVNKRALQNLIFSGAFDNIYEVENLKERKQIFEELSTIKKDVEIPDFNEIKFSIQQREITGYNFSSKSDLSKILKVKDEELFKKYIKPQDFLNLKKLKTDLVCCVGFIENYKERESKNGEFCNLTINSDNQKINILIWSDVWSELKTKLLQRIKENPNTVIIISGIMKFDDFKNVNILQTCKNSIVYLINV